MAAMIVPTAPMMATSTIACIFLPPVLNKSCSALEQRLLSDCEEWDHSVTAICGIISETQDPSSQARDGPCITFAYNSRDMTRRPLVIVAVILAELFALHASAQNAQLVVTHAHIMTMAPGQQTPIDGYIAVAADGTILSVGAGLPPPLLHAAETIDAHGDWMIPGFISAHSHLWQAAYRGLAASNTLPGWIEDLYGKWASRATADDFYWFCLYGGLDHLQHGVTAAYNFNYTGVSTDANRDNRFNKIEFRAEV